VVTCGKTGWEAQWLGRPSFDLRDSSAATGHESDIEGEGDGSMARYWGFIIVIITRGRSSEL